MLHRYFWISDSAADFLANYTKFFAEVNQQLWIMVLNLGWASFTDSALSGKLALLSPTIKLKIWRYFI